MWAFFIPAKSAAILVIAITLTVAGLGKPENRVYLYIGSIAAIPLSFTFQVPFPGLNYLTVLDYAKVSAIFLLGPVFVRAFFSERQQYLKTVDTLLLIYVLLTSLMSFRDLPFTSVLRVMVDQFLLVFVPYIAISRTLKTQEQIERALKAFFVSVVILAGIGVISTLKSWNYYVHLADTVGALAFIDYRNGFLRIGATLVPALLGLLMGIGAVQSLQYKSAKEMPVLYSFGLAAVFGFVLFVTGARGGWLAAIVIVLSYYMLTRFQSFGRYALMGGLAFGLIGVVVLVLGDSDLISDKYGTFDYRAELLRTSLVQIADRPLFGSADFLETQRFAHLVQGQGIIDLVNAYLQITLYYGLVGLGLYVGAHYLVLINGMKLLSKLPPIKIADEQSLKMRRTVSLLVASQLGFLALIATISTVSHIWHYGMIILAVLAAQVRVFAYTGEKEVSPAPVESNGLSEPSLPSDPLPKKLPYGARFVRRT